MGCANNYKYIVTVPEPNESITFVEELDSFLRSNGFISDSKSYEKDDREFYEYMKNKYPNYIDRWTISYRSDNFFDYWEYVFIFVWKKKNSYLLDIRKGRNNDKLRIDEYVDSLKEWLRSRYPEEIIDIRRVDVFDMS